jgi:hypothetical protein
MKILKPMYPCEGCCDQCYALDDLRVFFDAAYCEYCWGELSEANWPLWDDADGAVALPEAAAVFDLAAAIGKTMEGNDNAE